MSELFGLDIKQTVPCQFTSPSNVWLSPCVNRSRNCLENTQWVHPVHPVPTPKANCVSPVCETSLTQTHLLLCVTGKSVQSPDLILWSVVGLHMYRQLYRRFSVELFALYSFSDRRRHFRDLNRLIRLLCTSDLPHHLSLHISYRSTLGLEDALQRSIA